MTTDLCVYYHTHWDREWYLTFRQYQHRLLGVVDKMLDEVETGQLPCFTLDGQTVVLEDYLEFRPDNMQRLKNLVRQDKISIGPWYVMPDEFLVGGESLIRNLQRGLAISREFGEKTFTGYLPDTFGHSADIPMLFRQFGIQSAILWRGILPPQAYFNWQSPNGDGVLTYHLTQGYFQPIFQMTQGNEAQKKEFSAWLEKLEPAAVTGRPLLFPFGADHLGTSVFGSQHLQLLAPDAQAVTPDCFMAQQTQIASDGLMNRQGELRDFEGAYTLPGVFSARLYLKQWNRRLEWRLARQLEQLLAWACLRGEAPKFEHELDLLWKTLLLNHPHDSICGCSIDAVHRENETRFEQIDQLSNAMVHQAHHRLQTLYQADEHILLVNLSDAPYTGVVCVEQNYPLNQPKSPVPAPHQLEQVLSETTLLDETYLEDPLNLALSDNLACRRKSLIWAENIPAHSVCTSTAPPLAPDTVAVSELRLENKYLRIQVESNGSLTITDKLTQIVYGAAHRFCRNKEQGDSYNAAPVPGAAVEWGALTHCEMVLTGPLRGALKLAYQFQSISMPITTVISLDAGSDRVNFETSFTNTAKDHKVQAVWHLMKPITEVTAEGHFAPVVRQYDPGYRIADNMPAEKFKELVVQGGPIQRFVGCQNQAWFTEGLTEYEVEGHDLKLTLLRAFGMLSKADTGVRGSHAGPPLETPQGQCLGRPASYRYAWQPQFDLIKAYGEADRFYGAVYGFNHSQGKNKNTAVKTIPTALTWDNSHIHSTAFLPVNPKQLTLRLNNPTPTNQTTRLAVPAAVQSMRCVDLNGQLMMDDIQNNELTITPYSVQTVELALE